MQLAFNTIGIYFRQFNVGPMQRTKHIKDTTCIRKVCLFVIIIKLEDKLEKSYMHIYKCNLFTSEREKNSIRIKYCMPIFM